MSSESKTQEGNKIPLRFRGKNYAFTDPVKSEDEDPKELDLNKNLAFSDGETTCVDADNYVRSVLSNQKPLPPITLSNVLENINWVSFLALTLTPVLTIYGLLTTKIKLATAIWSVVYYFVTGLGITAGYHRLWAHRSYTASKPLQYILALAGSGAVEGSIKWWSRGHRAHHRYTDTDLDPYSASKGLFWSHIGWMIFKARRRPGMADISDLKNNKIVIWQHNNFITLLFIMGFIVPTVIAGLGWNDYRGGFFFAGAARLMFVHHSTFCVNSLAHWLGETPFDDKHTPKDHIVTAFVTLGEGYHNFHHEFPHDYRNAIKWYQYDPTKWFIGTMKFLGLASQLKQFPANEIRKGLHAMKLKRLANESKSINWPESSEGLPVLTWEEFEEASKTKLLVVIAGYIHDVSTFIDEHPGGRAIVRSRIGKDATNAFYGGVYDHSNAAGNLLAMLRVGCIEGGYEVESLKKYSVVIENLLKSGANGVEGKSSDVSSESKKLVKFQTYSNQRNDLSDLDYNPSLLVKA